MLQTSVKTSDVLTFSFRCKEQALCGTFTVTFVWHIYCYICLAHLLLHFFVYRFKSLSKKQLLGLRTTSDSSTTSALFWYMTLEGRMSTQMTTLKMDAETAAETPFHLNYLMWLSAQNII